MTAILALIIIYILSIIGVIVIYKCVKSSAEISTSFIPKGIPEVPENSIAPLDEFKKKKRQIKLKGGIAGFVIIFGLLTNSYLYLSQKGCDGPKPESQFWTVTGNIVKEDSKSYEGVDVQYQPPSPALEIHSENGSFNLYRVKIMEDCDNGWPTLQFSCKGFSPDNYKIDPYKDTIDKNDKVIRLKDDIFLLKNFE